MTAHSAGLVAIDTVLRTVPDLGAAERFYRDAFACSVVEPAAAVPEEDRALLGANDSRVGRLALHLGAQILTFLCFEPPGRAYPADSTATDLWFQHCAIVVQDMAEAHARVMSAGARPITRGAPQHLPANTGGVSAFKFRDPFGHPLELLQFPHGVGAAAWQRPSDALFRGIDHTAIAVSSCQESRDFYTQALGLHATDSSHNHGEAQSRLDAVANDDVDVVALEPHHAPPHLELLAYRSGTRRALGDVGAADAVRSRTLASGDIEMLAARIEARGITGLRHGRWQGRAAVAFSDPDGHAWICRASS